jgi:hypothetical protein
MKRIVLGSVALSLALVVAGCGTDDKTDEGSSTSSSTESTVTSTTSAPSTTEPASSDTTEPTIPASNAEEYVDALIAAWTSGDRDFAEELAVPTAVETLFSYEPAEDGVEPTWAIEVCEGAAGSSYCTVGAGGDAKIVVRVMNEAASQGAEQAVTEVTVDS